MLIHEITKLLLMKNTYSSGYIYGRLALFFIKVFLAKTLSLVAFLSKAIHVEAPFILI